MKLLRTALLSTLVISMLTFTGCPEDDPDPSLVNFDQAAYNITTDDLSPFEISLNIDPAANEDSEITVSFSGATPGTEFATTPAASGNSVTIPVSAGDTEVSFTFTPSADGIGFNNVNVQMSLSDVGSGLTTGLVIESLVAITNTLDTGEELPYSETFGSCAPDVELPGGFQNIVVQQNSAGTGGWRCVTFGGVGYAASNPFTGCDASTSDPSEVWLVSPRFNLIDATNPTLTFDAALVFGPFDQGPDWNVLISTDFNGDNFEASTWTELDDANTQLGAITRGNDLQTITQDLSAYTGEVVAVAIAHIMPGTGCGSGSSGSGAFRIGDFSVTD